MRPRPLSVALAASVVLSAGLSASQGPGAVDDLSAVLASLAQRTQQYYERFISIICTETAHQQDLGQRLAPAGKPRVTVYELSVTREVASKNANDQFKVGRTLLSVDGRSAASRQTPRCTDPKTGTPEPLAFLLAENQSRFQWSFRQTDRGGPAGARALDFAEARPKPANVTWNGDCFQADFTDQAGRVWFDPATFDILQVESRSTRPVLVRASSGGVSTIRLERYESTVKFANVSFQNPDETVLLPESIETLTVFRGATSRRTRQVLSNFRRFLSESIIR